MMIVIMRAEATMREKSAVIARAEDFGFKVHLSDGKERTIIGIIGDDRVINRDQIERMPGVERVVPILKPFKLASREFRAEDTTFPPVSYTHLDVYKRQVQAYVNRQPAGAREKGRQLVHAIADDGHALGLQHFPRGR